MRFFWLLCGIAAAVTPLAYAESEDLKGSDWAQMEQTQKELFVYTAVGALEQDGVVFTRPSLFYVEALDKLLSMDPAYQEEYLDNLFVFAVYEHETQSRRRIDALKKERIAEAEVSASSDKTG